MTTREAQMEKYAAVYKHLKQLPGGMLKCEIAKMLGSNTKNAAALVTAMECNGFLMYEDENTGRIYAFKNKNERTKNE